MTHYLKDLAEWAGLPRLTGLAFLVLALAVTEGIGLALLAPLFLSMGLSSSTGQPALPGLLGRVEAEFPMADMTLGPLLAALVVAISVRAILGFVRDIVVGRLRFGFVDALRLRLFHAFAHSEWPFLVRRRQGDLIALLGGDLSRVGVGTQYVVRLPAIVTVMAVQVAVALSLAPLVALPMVLGAALLGLSLRVRGRRAMATGSRLMTGQGRQFAEIVAFLGGLKTAKSQGQEDRHVAAYGAIAAQIRDESLAFVAGSARARMMLQIMAALFVAVPVFVVTTYEMVEPAVLLVFIAIIARLVPLAQEAQAGFFGVRHMLPAFDAVTSACRDFAQHAEPAAEHSMPPLRREIRLENVGFRHHADGPFLFRNVNAVVTSGELVVVAGPSGIGKTTLADVILGLIQPVEGRVLVDDVPLQGGLLRAWRHHLAYVPQDPVLVHGTVAENFALAAPDADDAEIRRVLELAACDGLVRRLPQGLHTMLADRGAGLSGGERQRLALAQALLRRPSLLVLDEVTSGLDQDTEKAVMRGLSSLKGQITILAISHRPDVAALADRVWDLGAHGLQVRVQNPPSYH